MSGETEANVSGWTVDTLSTHMQRQHDDLIRMLDERYQTQTKAVDAAFLAQQTAMQTALSAAEKAVATALLAAEKAVAKAEQAAEKRFDSVNEFRGQLADQAATFISRAEADARRSESDARLAALADKVTTETSRNADTVTKLERNLTTRLDLSQGADSGSVAADALRRATTMQMVGVIGALFAAVSIAITLIIAFK